VSAGVFATIRRYELGAGSMPDLMRIVDSELSGRLSREPGFASHTVVATGDDSVLAMTLFRQEPGSAAAGRIVAEFVRDRLQPFQLSLISELSGEVGVTRGGLSPDPPVA
jgi:hypothetical protein